MNISVQVQDVYIQLWIPLFRVGPYLNCITRHLRQPHRTSSVSSSIFNVMDIVQHKDLSHTERRQRPCVNIHERNLRNIINNKSLTAVMKLHRGKDGDEEDGGRF